jgi:hypothetical protein
MLVVFMLCGVLAACATPGDTPEQYRPPRITHPLGKVYSPDASERADIAAALGPALGGRQPELGKLLSLTAHGGIETCGMIRSGSSWQAFAMMRPSTGKPDIKLAQPNTEMSLLDICAAEGLPLTD